MPSLLLSWQIPGQAQPKQMYLDASLNEQHITAAQVTEHQVENGVNITDHIRPMPKSVMIEGILTNTPLGSPTTYGVAGSVRQTQIQPQSSPVGQPPPVRFSVFTFDNVVDRVKAAYPDLVTACLNGYLFKIATSLATYENMAATNLSVPRNAQEANHLHFTLQFQEVRIVKSSSSTVAVPPKINKGPIKPTTPKNNDPNKNPERESLARQAGVSRLLGVQ